MEPVTTCIQKLYVPIYSSFLTISLFMIFLVFQTFCSNLLEFFNILTIHDFSCLNINKKKNEYNFTLWQPGTPFFDHQKATKPLHSHKALYRPR